jgi:AhpD family alkylhydroperoxidase
MQYRAGRTAGGSPQDLSGIRRQLRPVPQSGRGHRACARGPAPSHAAVARIARRQTLPKRALELAIVTVSQLNSCHYCVAHHKPFLAVEGVSAAGADWLLDYPNHPELDAGDKLVVRYAIAAWEHPDRIPDGLFRRLREHFSEAQIVELTLRITLCGFFNKFNDALQIEEEPEAVTQLTAVAG